MSPTLRSFPVAFFAAALALASTTAKAENPDTSNKWRVQVAGESTADGVVLVRLSEIGNVIAEIPVTVPKHSDKKGVAQRIRDSLNGSLDANRYTVEVDDGNDVLVKAREDVKDFELAIVRNTADGTKVTADKE
jgi:hypothetical protein